MTYTFTCEMTALPDSWFRAERDGQFYDAPTPLRAVAGLLTKLDGMVQSLPPMPIEYRGQMVQTAVPVMTFSPAELLGA